MSENNYQITIPYKDYKRLKLKESKLEELEKNIRGCFEMQRSIISNTVLIHKQKLILIGKDTLPIYYKNMNFVEV